ncbi:MAG TPA: hypothetical protein VFQ61_12905, partial [Polyangiaceae bacterium]|nr:hypothetical protein [Polyangiaceae bacterium]
TAKRGIMKVSIVGFSLQGKELARIGGVELNLVDASNEPPPSLPGKEPPMRCYDPGDCPNELKGSPACPGTKAVAGAKTWGAACTASADCQKGLVCMSGTCEQPPKCDSGAECASGECANGVCVVTDPGEPTKTIGPPKYNWIGLHLALDSMFVRDAVGVCGNTTDDAGDYSCFEGGNEYKGQPNRASAGNVKSGFRFGTIRALLSYERWFGRLSAGARLGFAIRGAPKGFMPVHAELRLLYSMRPDPLSKRIRPYAGLFAGLMEVQASSRATVIDCIEESLVARQACIEQSDSRTLTTTQAAIKRFDAFRDGSSFGFGPTLGLYTALANDSALNFNLNLVLPNMAFQLSAGYLMGL